jgi:AraC-like DNA-binding protein
VVENLDLTYNLQSFLDIIGFIQGITLGILLLILNYKRNRSSFFLGLFLVFFSLKLAYFIPKGLHLEFINQLFLLPFNFSWLLFALFFVYTQQVSIFANQKTPYWVLIPGFVSFVLQVVIYFQPYETKLVISQSFWYETYFTFIGIAYSWAIGIWNLKLLSRHRVEAENTFSFMETRTLHWAFIFLIYSLVTSVTIHVLYLLSPQNYYFKVIFSIFDLIAIYWIASKGILQRNTLSSLTNNLAGFGTADTALLVNPVPTIDKEELERLMKQVDTYINTSECFASPELTIIDVADKLKVHPRRISTAINTIVDQNFNSYINWHRIQKAIRLLKSESLGNFSVEGIGTEVGFNSKSAFYSAFKKVTGTTPYQFREKQLS